MIGLIGIERDLELSRWLARKSVVPLMRYLIVTKHHSTVRDDILSHIFVDNTIPAAPGIELQVDHEEETVSLRLQVLFITETQKAIEQDSSAISPLTQEDKVLLHTPI